MPFTDLDDLGRGQCVDNESAQEAVSSMSESLNHPYRTEPHEGWGVPRLLPPDQNLSGQVYLKMNRCIKSPVLVGTKWARRQAQVLNTA
jgi:hypothetical protein